MIIEIRQKIMNSVRWSHLREYNSELYRKAKKSTIAEEDKDYFKRSIEENRLVSESFLFGPSKDGYEFWCNALLKVYENKIESKKV